MIKINSVYISTIVVKPYPQVKYTLETGLYENIKILESENVLNPRYFAKPLHVISPVFFLTDFKKATPIVKTLKKKKLYCSMLGYV